MPVVGLARDLGILWVSGTRREHRAPKGARAWSLLPSKVAAPFDARCSFRRSPAGLGSWSMR